MQVVLAQMNGRATWMTFAIVVLLIAVVIVLTPYFVHQYTFQQHDRITTLLRAKALVRSIQLYTDSNDDFLPAQFQDHKDLVDSLSKYSDSEDFESMNPKGSYFLPNKNFEGRNFAKIQDKQTNIIVFESTPWHDGKKACGFLDGHSAFVNSNVIFDQ